MSDDSTAITYVNKQGRTQSTTCNQFTKDIWITCMEKGTTASAAHTSGKQNTSERMLSKNIFNHLIPCFGMSKIDLFTSRLNTRLHLPGCLIQMLYQKSFKSILSKINIFDRK